MPTIPATPDLDENEKRWRSHPIMGPLLARREEPELKSRRTLQAIRADIWDKTDGVCVYCGCRINPFRNWSIDHVIPRSKGGTDDLDNLVPACLACNVKKGAR